MTFVFKGEASHWDSENADRIFQGLSVLRLEMETRLFDVSGVNPIPVVSASDLTEALDVDVINAFIFRIDVADGGSIIQDLVLRQPGPGQETDQYRIQLDGPPVSFPTVGSSIENYFSQFGINGSNPDQTDVDLAAAERFEFIGETGVDLLTGTEAEREARAERIAYVYEAGLDRDGNIDEGGLNFWIDAAGRGLSDRQIAQAFIDSPEFAASFGAPDGLSDFEFVTVLYENVLDRVADDPGRDFWLSVLGRPEVGRNELLLAFADSNENVAGSPTVETLTETLSGIWEFA